MKVSVLVTFYNQEDYVDEALQSVFDQKCDFDFEVLIGDDGSTDGTMAKLQIIASRQRRIRKTKRNYRNGSRNIRTEWKFM